MTTPEQIQEVAQRIGKEFRPQRVILFGSYARGKPTSDSDVDLLVITSVERRTADKAVEILLRVRPPFPIDLLVRTPQQVQERLELGDVFMREVLEQGQVLYETDHARVGNESGRRFPRNRPKSFRLETLNSSISQLSFVFDFHIDFSNAISKPTMKIR
ncbi:MAG: nucleotidyltransferase domain-containing protein [bacterium]